MKNIIGRKKEIEELNRLYNSTIPQLWRYMVAGGLGKHF
jgi:hypothetical protein